MNDSKPIKIQFVLLLMKYLLLVLLLTFSIKTDALLDIKGSFEEGEIDTLIGGSLAFRGLFSSGVMTTISDNLEMNVDSENLPAVN